MFSPTKLKEKEKVKGYRNHNLHPVWESVESHTLIGNQVKQNRIKII
ncbi:conserved domain protein [Streptococcus mitis bv. 2 str. SK95]|uniref:Conserved domain protein n=1 Tax=Streptococcus mitis bv. 2 str. SK95 TaxID=1000588 RepID=F9LVV2_STROR|nr:conserved domain protein [Streptococcus mitis bv. 2 str. SK95]